MKPIETSQKVLPIGEFSDLDSIWKERANIKDVRPLVSESSYQSAKQTKKTVLKNLASQNSSVAKNTRGVPCLQLTKAQQATTY